LRQVQQVCGTADDPMECSEGIHHHSEVIETTASAGKHSGLWLGYFTGGYADTGKQLLVLISIFFICQKFVFSVAGHITQQWTFCNWWSRTFHI